MTAGIGAADAAIYTGICLENNDPMGQGRIKYCVPQLSGTAGFGWAFPVTPGYTPIGSNVYIAFEGGDRNRPLYWPDQLPLASYPTFAAANSAYPTATTPAGTELYIVDHGGNVQLQNTGVTPTSVGWQWLPSGYQGSSRGFSPQVSAIGGTTALITSTAFSNPSIKRFYRIVASANLYGSTTGMTLSIGVLLSTSTLPSTPSVNSLWIQENAVTSVGTANGTPSWVGLNTVTTTQPTGVLRVGVYLINRGIAANTGTTSTIGWYEISVEDIGAST